MSSPSRRDVLRGAVSVPLAMLGAGSTAPDPRGDEAMENALELLSTKGPEFHGGLANHGPMAAEALVTLGRPQAVVPWVEGYRRQLDDRPASRNAIPGNAWREALGDRARLGDWIAFFRRRVEEKPWGETVAEWVPRLAPGMIAAAFHGLIRAGHAARSLARRETPARRRELADGLAYWAASYYAFPEGAGVSVTPALPSKALPSVASVPPERRVLNGFILARLAPLQSFEPFAGVAAMADTSGDPSLFLSDLTETFAGVFLASVPPGSVIGFLHAITGPSALRLLLPYLPAASVPAALRYAWQGAAAHYSGFGGVLARRSADRVRGDLAERIPAAPPGAAQETQNRAADHPADLIDQAIATGDEHAIKLTEACLREYALQRNAVYLHTARHAIDRLG